VGERRKYSLEREEEGWLRRRKLNLVTEKHASSKRGRQKLPYMQTRTVRERGLERERERYDEIAVLTLENEYFSSREGELT